MIPSNTTSVGPTGQSHWLAIQKPINDATPPISEAKMVNWRMVRANKCAVSGGSSRKPNEINGPTLNTAMETVKPINRYVSASQNTTFLRSVTASVRSNDTSINSL